MKRSLILSLFPLLVLFTSSAWGNDLARVRKEIVGQMQDPNSFLNQEVQGLKSSAGIPVESRLELGDESLIWPQDLQTYLDCEVSPCQFLERQFFVSWADLRWEQRLGGGIQIRLWPLAVWSQILRVWQSNPEGEKLSLKREELKLTNVHFFTN